MRKKIFIGFIGLVVLLTFAGAISIFEMNRLQSKTQDIISEGARNAVIGERMVDGLQMQNSSVIRMIVSVYSTPDEEYNKGTAVFLEALEEASQTGDNTQEVENINAANDNYHAVIAGYANERLDVDMEWFANIYLQAYYGLDRTIKEYLSSPTTSLSSRTTQLETSVYRTITPSILTLLVAIVIILMFLFFIDFYYIQPLQKLNKGLRRYIDTRMPFDYSFESNDDVEELKESVLELIEQTRKHKL